MTREARYEMARRVADALRAGSAPRVEIPDRELLRRAAERSEEQRAEFLRMARERREQR